MNAKKPAHFEGYEVLPGAVPGTFIVQDAYGIPARKIKDGKVCFIKGWKDDPDKGRTYFVGDRHTAMPDIERLPAEGIVALPEGDLAPLVGHS